MDSYSLDDKGRLTIPRRAWRPLFDEVMTALVVNDQSESRVSVYPFPKDPRKRRKLYRRIAQYNFSLDSEFQDDRFLQAYVGLHIFEQHVDSMHRVILPEASQKHLTVPKNRKLVVVFNHLNSLGVDAWNPQQYQRYLTNLVRYYQGMRNG